MSPVMGGRWRGVGAPGVETGLPAITATRSLSWREISREVGILHLFEQERKVGGWDGFDDGEVEEVCRYEYPAIRPDSNPSEISSATKQTGRIHNRPTRPEVAETTYRHR